MEVKIGIAESPRELVVSSAQTSDEVEALVNEALKSADATLTLTDEKGRRYLVPSSRISYIEIAPSSASKVGFGS
ncbi:DUF3107 domain-containing protein [Pseudonocardia ailaonensis]|uniref:DUF3107 domain-containing protein n=1 Tax=Pseudonocardia ailaonensis TaxID=367279 RepID=A0ABN2MZ43_9PSEU